MVPAACHRRDGDRTISPPPLHLTGLRNPYLYAASFCSQHRAWHLKLSRCPNDEVARCCHIFFCFPLPFIFPSDPVGPTASKLARPLAMYWHRRKQSSLTTSARPLFLAGNHPRSALRYVASLANAGPPSRLSTSGSHRRSTYSCYLSRCRVALRLYEAGAHISWRA